MGSELSVYVSQPLSPLSSPVCCFSPEYCLPTGSQLHASEHAFSFSGNDFDVWDLLTGEHYFRCEGRIFSMRFQKYIYDKNRRPIFNVKSNWYSTKSYGVYTGDTSTEDNHVFQIYSPRICTCETSLRTEFVDAVTGELRRIVFKGDWRGQFGTIYLELNISSSDVNTSNHNTVPLARIFRVNTQRQFFLCVDDFVLEVAAGMDIAVCFAITLALEDMCRSFSVTPPAASPRNKFL